MKWTLKIRQVHRWLSIIFTLAVLINIAAMTQGQPPIWIGLLALFPLILLLASGLYLFALPYAARWRHSQEGAMAGEKTDKPVLL